MCIAEHHCAIVQLQSSRLACASSHAANFDGSSACFIVRMCVESASDGVLMGNDKVLDSAGEQPLNRDRKKTTFCFVCRAREEKEYEHSVS